MKEFSTLKTVILFFVACSILFGCGGKKEEISRLPVDKWATDFYAVDVISTATYKRWIPGSKPLMPQEMLRMRIADVVGGVKQLYIVATVLNGKVASTVMEMVLDPVDMILYGITERGTELHQHLVQNPMVSINFHHEFPNDWFKGLCFQIRGMANLFSGPFTDGQPPREVKRFHQLYSMDSAMWLSEEARDVTSRAFADNLTIFTVVADQIVYHDARMPFENYNLRQLWSRNW
jgi:hypothetical protein